MQRFLIAASILAALLLSCASTESATSGGGNEAAAAVTPPASPKTVITLESKDAKLFTTSRLVYNANANCVAWWEKKTDEISWNLKIKEAGEYYVVAAVACDPQFPGSTVGVTVNNQTLTFSVPDTMSWNTYVNVTAGKIALQPGTHPVVVKAIKIPSSFVANLRTLTFVKSAPGPRARFRGAPRFAPPVPVSRRARPPVAAAGPGSGGCLDIFNANAYPDESPAARQAEKTA